MNGRIIFRVPRDLLGLIFGMSSCRLQKIYASAVLSQSNQSNAYYTRLCINSEISVSVSEVIIRRFKSSNVLKSSSIVDQIQAVVMTSL